jgi:hypothetical protein
MNTNLTLISGLSFVALWSAAGWIAGRFFGRVRRFQKTGQWIGRWPLLIEQLGTLALFLALIVGASTIDGQAAVVGAAKVCAIVGTIVCVGLAYRVSAARRSSEVGESQNGKVP